MKKYLVAAMAVAFSLGWTARSQAQDAGQLKPIVVFSVSAFDEIHQDLDMIGKISNFPDLSKSVDTFINRMTGQSTLLPGLDKSRAWGGAVMMNGGGNPIRYAFVPVSDAQQLLGAVAPLSGGAQDAPGEPGLKLISRPGSKVYLKPEQNWLFASDQAESLRSVPSAPADLLDDLHKEYDVAVRFYVRNIPQQYRDMALDQIRAGFEQAMRQRGGQIPGLQQFGQNPFEQMVQAIDQIEHLTLGWAIDSKQKRMVFDFSMTAVEGSELARQSNDTQPPARLAGFMAPEATLALHVNGGIKVEDQQQLNMVMQQAKAQVAQALDNERNIPDAERAVAKELVGDFMNVLQDTFAKGQINAGMAVYGSGPISLVAGGIVADGRKVGGIIRKAVDRYRNQPGFPQVVFDKEKAGDLSFHVLSTPYPPGAQGEESKKWLGGDAITITFAFGPEHAFIAMGADGAEAIKQVIAKSSGTPADDAPFRMSISLTKLMEIAAKQPGGNPLIGMMTGLLGTDGKDHLHLSSRPIKNGVLMRLETEEGFLRFLGGASRFAGSGF